MTDNTNKHASGRHIVGEDGKSQPVMVDRTPGADNSAAHGYDGDHGAHFNKVMMLQEPERSQLLSLPPDTQRQLIALPSAERSAKIADAVKPKAASPKTPDPKSEGAKA